VLESAGDRARGNEARIRLQRRRVAGFPALAALFACAAAAVSCGEERTRTFVVTTHEVSGCAAESLEPRLELQPMGDYPEVSPLSFGADEPSADLAIPLGTRALGARRRSAGARTEDWVGYAERGVGREVPILLWPRGRECELVPHRAEYPLGAPGRGIGFSAVTRAVLIAGASELTSATVSALTFDAGTGTSELLTSAEPGKRMSEARAHATITAFGDRLLVAGGEDPFQGDMVEVVTVRRTAELFDPLSAEFLPAPIELDVGRSRHAAVVLPNGDTLLVGGRRQFGDALSVLEVVSPQTEQATIAGLPALQIPRLFPAVLPLDDGRLFVGGGEAADRTPLAALEWLSADARAHLRSELPDDLPPRYDRAFAAMPGGGVLMVGGCEPRSEEDDAECMACRDGCPPRSSSGARAYDAWWVTPDYAVEKIPLPVAAPRPVLLGGDGKPLLVPGDPEDPRAAYRFDPWTSKFERSEVELSEPPRPGYPVIALDAEAFVWSSARDGRDLGLFGLRTGTGSRYGRAGSLGNVDETPLQLVPDRPVGERPTASFDGTSLHFTAGSPVRVFIPTLDFDDFELELEVAEESVLPRLVLTATERIGPQIVELPAVSQRRLIVKRAGRRLSFSPGDAPDVTDLPSGRVKLGVACGDGDTRLVAFSVRRAER